MSQKLRDFIKKTLKENLNKFLQCPNLKLTQEIIDEINKFETSEQFLRAGGLSIEALDRAAYGFSSDDIKILTPNKLHIKWKEDWENVKWEQEKSQLSKRDYAKKINLSEPIDVSYEKGKFYVEDGHHRLFAASILKKTLNINLVIKDNPILKLAPELSYDNFHRCIFNQVKNLNKEALDEYKSLYEDTTKEENKKPYKFYLLCDKLCNLEGVEVKNKMVSDASPISRKIFVANCAYAKELFLYENQMADDPTHGFYKSNVKGVPCCYMQYAGFEFIFLKDYIGGKEYWLDEQIIKEVRNGKPEVKTVYHGTSLKKVEKIKAGGLQAGSMGYESAGWYLVSTDFDSALFHATAENGEQAPVFEFEIPVDNTKWEGYPYFWPPYERNTNSKWFALKQPLPRNFIKKIHYVNYEDFIKQKHKGF